MKASVIIIVLIFFNTTALIAEPVADLFKSVNPWVFIAIEAILLIGYFLNNITKDLRRLVQLDCNNLNLFVVKSKPTKTKSV